MADGSRVRLGVCDVTWGVSGSGYVNDNYAGTVPMDLGYTKGGVVLTIETQTHEVIVDQEGPSPVNEVIMGRRAQVVVPVAETYFPILQMLMPGSQLVNSVLQLQSGAGEELMDYADVLKLHPHAYAASNKSYDVTLWKAAPTANAVITYAQDGEWVYNVTFKGYVPADSEAHAGIILEFGDAS